MWAAQGKKGERENKREGRACKYHSKKGRACECHSKKRAEHVNTTAKRAYSI
jgi:hypothetical protein